MNRYERLDSPDPESTELHGLESFSSDNAIVYSSLKQARNIAKARLLGFVRTVLFVLLIALIIRIWEQKGIIPTSQKTLFNFFSTVLSIALGLNFSEAFKSLAKVIRWRYLAHERRSIRETDLALGSDNFLTVIALARETISKPWTSSLCISWIILFLGAQAAISLVTLTYDFNGGVDYQSTFTTSGNVTAPKLSCFFHGQNCPKPRTKQGLAHSYGQLALNADQKNYTEISEVYASQEKHDYYCRRTPNRQEFAYRFLEYNPIDKQRAYPWMTDRVITSYSGECITYNEINNTLNPASRNYTYSNGSSIGWIDVPYALENAQGTTYIYRGFHPPEIAPLQHCGPRCTWIWAHRASGAGQNSTFYQCPISISHVSNARDPKHYVPDDVALLAAASIGVNGRVNGGSGSWAQFQFSPFGTAWEIHYKDPDAVGANMAEFAIASIAFMATHNPMTSFHGNLTHLGQRLDPHWQSAIPLLAVIVAAHFALFAAAVYTSRKVVVPDDSNLAVARLLRPLVAVLGDTGTAMEGKEMSKKISENPQYKDGVVSGPRVHTRSDEYVLDLAGGIKTASEWPAGAHPNGKYR